MKVKNITILFFLLSYSFVSNAQFTADLVQVQKGKEKHYKVASDGSMYRYDFDDAGMKGVVIVDPASGKTAILIPDEKFVHYTDPMSMISLMNDPLQAYNYSRENYTEKDLGKEELSGFTAHKTELYSGDQKIYTVWYSDKLNFLLKMINALADNTYVELTNIKQQKVDPQLFVVPKDYTEVDEKMRPVVPEPPPPENWSEKKVRVPFDMVVKRGEKIRFSITYPDYSKLMLSNHTETPSKVIWYNYRNGEQLPFNDQGPVSYRTKRLFAGENKNLTYSWKEGDEIVLECYEGEMQVSVKPEER